VLRACDFWVRSAAIEHRPGKVEDRTETGDTPAQFTERARADAARCKLEQTVLPVETIAKECGFGNAERMRRTFQRFFEVSPSDYRARFRSTLFN
jgi:transcriptional regulator GlxA family with amidase domain